jgi:predicted nuclease with TOPRIM domain
MSTPGPIIRGFAVEEMESKIIRVRLHLLQGEIAEYTQRCQELREEQAVLREELQRRNESDALRQIP